MKISESTVTKLLISDLDRFDPISVILEDHAAGKGKIIVECYGKTWSGHWGAMGSRTIAQFFQSCDEDYLANRLSSVNEHVTDYDELVTRAKRAVCSSRRRREIDYCEAKDLYDAVESFFDQPINQGLFEKVFGMNIWEYDMPTKKNHEYTYLTDIIKIVKTALAIRDE